MVKYSKEKIKEEMDRLISSFWLQKQVTDLFLESFKMLLYVDIDKKYWKYVLFTQALVSKYVVSLITIIADPDTISNNNIFLYNNIMKSLLLKN